MSLTFPCYWMRKDARNQWYWTYHARTSGETIARSSESYVNKADCARSIEIVKESRASLVYETN